MATLHWQSVLTIIFPSLLLTVLAWVFYRYPPATINPRYGYRTPLSMKNVDTWQTANRLAARYNLFLSAGVLGATLLCMIILGKSGLLTVFGSLKSFFFWVMGFSTGAILLTILLVEYALRKRFDRQGNRTHYASTTQL